MAAAQDSSVAGDSLAHSADGTETAPRTPERHHDDDDEEAPKGIYCDHCGNEDITRFKGDKCTVCTDKFMSPLGSPFPEQGHQGGEDLGQKGKNDNDNGDPQKDPSSVDDNQEYCPQHTAYVVGFEHAKKTVAERQCCNGNCPECRGPPPGLTTCIMHTASALMGKLAD